MKDILILLNYWFNCYNFYKLCIQSNIEAVFKLSN